MKNNETPFCVYKNNAKIEQKEQVIHKFKVADAFEYDSPLLEDFLIE